MCALALGGVGARIGGAAVSTSPGSPLASVSLPRAGTFRTDPWQHDGILLSVAGCDRPVGLAWLPGYDGAVSPSVPDWGRGASVTAYGYAGRRVPGRWIRAVSVGGHFLMKLAAGVGVPGTGRWDGVAKAFAPPGCDGAVDAVLGSMGGPRT